MLLSWDIFYNLEYEIAQLITAVWRNGGGRGKLKGSTSNNHLCYIDSEVLLNPPLRQAANRYEQG